MLIQRCFTRNGRHDFVTGEKDVSLTVFLSCLAELTHSDIGPRHRWSCGEIYDNVKGGMINVQAGAAAILAVTTAGQRTRKRLVRFAAE